MLSKAGNLTEGITAPTRDSWQRCCILHIASRNWGRRICSSSEGKYNSKLCWSRSYSPGLGCTNIASITRQSYRRCSHIQKKTVQPGLANKEQLKQTKRHAPPPPSDASLLPSSVRCKQEKTNTKRRQNTCRYHFRFSITSPTSHSSFPFPSPPQGVSPRETEYAGLI